MSSPTLARPAATPPAPRQSAGWLQGPAHDLLLAGAWVPFAIAARAAADDPSALRWVVSATLVVSFAHQPSTLWLVYGDRAQRRSHATVFAWAPLAVLVAVSVGAVVGPVLLATVAGAWNAWHTLRQRYGLSRLYGRRCGVDCAADNRLLWSWFVLAVLVALATSDLRTLASDAGLGNRNATAVEALASVRPAASLLLPIAALVALVSTGRAAAAERGRRGVGTARRGYLASTAALLVVLAVDPVTGFVAYVGGHAVEYLLVVRWRVGQAAGVVVPGSHVGAVGRLLGGAGTVGACALLAVGLLALLRAGGGPVALAVVTSLGALHLLYDGIIWRSPSPAAAPGGRR